MVSFFQKKYSHMLSFSLNITLKIQTLVGNWALPTIGEPWTTQRSFSNWWLHWEETFSLQDGFCGSIFERNKRRTASSKFRNTSNPQKKSMTDLTFMTYNLYRTPSWMIGNLCIYVYVLCIHNFFSIFIKIKGSRTFLRLRLNLKSLFTDNFP